MDMINRRQLEAHQYGVAIICPLEVEMSAVRYMLDEEHKPIPSVGGDINLYIFGRLGQHNVILGWLPKGSQGIGSAATVATHMKRSFPSAQLRLLVGIGGGVPSAEPNLRLGDVVIAMPDRSHGGLIQYDLGKQFDTGFQRKGVLRPPPDIWRNAVVLMESNHRVRQNAITQHLSQMIARYPNLSSRYSSPGPEHDVLFEKDNLHVTGKTDCGSCDPSKTVSGRLRSTATPKIFYGPIASGNSVMKSAELRDKISAEAEGALCFEMEAAGLVNDFECIVIRGICDYADSHKNDVWQAYAAASAAGTAKELLCDVFPSTGPQASPYRAQDNTADELLVRRHPLLAGTVDDFAQNQPSDDSNRPQHLLDFAKQYIRHQMRFLAGFGRSEANIRATFRDSFKKYDYESDLSGKLADVQPGTCSWVFKHHTFESWFPLETSRLMWLSGGPGLGKSALMASLVESTKAYLEDRKQSDLKVVLYSFWDKTFNNTASTMMSTMIHQLFIQFPQALESALQLHKTHRSSQQFGSLWSLLCAIIEDIALVRVFLICDGLDNLGADVQLEMMQTFRCSNGAISVLVSSQLSERVKLGLSKTIRKGSKESYCHLIADDEEDAINSDIEKFVSAEIARISNLEQRTWTGIQQDMVRKYFASKKSGVFLPIVIAFKKLEFMPTTMLATNLQHVLVGTGEIDDMIRNLIRNTPGEVWVPPSKLIKYALYASRPLRSTEMAFACNYTYGNPESRPEEDLQRLYSDVHLHGPILRHRKAADTIDFYHESINKYFKDAVKTPGHEFAARLPTQEDGHYELASTCLSLLISLSNGVNIPENTEDFYAKKLRKSLSQHDFLEYAIDHWSIHLREVFKSPMLRTKERVKLETLLQTMVDISYDNARKTFIWFCITNQSACPFRDLHTELRILNVYCWLGSLQSVKAMYEAKNITSDPQSLADSRSALFIAARAGQLTIFEYLWDRCDPLSFNDQEWSEILIGTAVSGNAAIFRKVLDARDWNLNTGWKVEDIGEAIISACSAENDEILAALMDYRIKVIALKSGERNVLQWLAIRRCGDIVDALQRVFTYFIDMGVSIHACDELGNTILHHICYDSQKCNSRLITTLIQRGAKPDEENRCGWRPFHLASRRAGIEALEAIISESNIDNISKASKQGLTALHWAMWRNIHDSGDDFCVLELLLKKGLDLRAATTRGDTPLSLALSNPYVFSSLSLAFCKMDGIHNISLSTLKFLEVLNHFSTIDELWCGLGVIGWLHHERLSSDSVSVSKWALSDDRKILHLFCILPRSVMRTIRLRILRWTGDPDLPNEDEKERWLLLCALLDFLLDYGRTNIQSRLRSSLKVEARELIQTFTISQQVSKEGGLMMVDTDGRYERLSNLFVKHREAEGSRRTIAMIRDYLRVAQEYPLTNMPLLSTTQSFVDQENDNENQELPAENRLELLRRLATRYYSQSRFEECVPLEQNVIDILRSSDEQRVGTYELADGLASLAMTKESLKANEDAISLYEEAISTMKRREMSRKQLARFAKYQMSLAACCFKTGKVLKGCMLKLDLVTRLSEQPNVDVDMYSKALEDLSDSYWMWASRDTSFDFLLKALSVLGEDEVQTGDRKKRINELMDKLLCRMVESLRDNGRVDAEVESTVVGDDTNRASHLLMQVQPYLNNLFRPGFVYSLSGALVGGCLAAATIAYRWWRKRAN